MTGFGRLYGTPVGVVANNGILFSGGWGFSCKAAGRQCMRNGCVVVRRGQQRHPAWIWQGGLPVWDDRGWLGERGEALRARHRLPVKGAGCRCKQRSVVLWRLCTRMCTAGNTCCGMRTHAAAAVDTRAAAAPATAEAALKGAHFIQLCAQRGVPLLFLQVGP